MKLRYVFPLMISAALSGGAVAHFRSQIADTLAESWSLIFDDKRERHRFAAKKEYLEFAGHYQKIADAMKAVCPMDYADGYNATMAVFPSWLEDIEKEWAAETIRLRGNQDVSRSGPLLRVKTKRRDIDVLDVGYLCHSADVRMHRYKGKLPKIGWHVVETKFYEGAHWALLISPKTGEAITAFGFLQESPSGKRVATYYNEEAEGGGYAIFRLDGERLVLELEHSPFEPQRLHPDFHLIDVVRWIDDERLELLVNQNKRITIVLRNGQWQVEAPPP